METAADLLMAIVGVVLVGAVLDSAVRTFVLPRGVVSWLTRAVFQAVSQVFRVFTRPLRTYEARDRAMALYAPLALVALVLVWIVLVIIGFALLFRAFVFPDWTDAFEMSGSSFFTLGFVRPPQGEGEWGYVLAFLEAGTGLALLALLIGYLPTIYGAFSRRELAVARLATRAGTPPSAVELLTRYHTVGWTDDLPSLWAEWENWFSELGETHTTFAMLAFFRSPNPHRSWVTSAGAVLDAAALAQSTLNVPWSPQAGMCIRAGYLALRDIATLYRIPFDADPAPDAPISIDRAEFIEAYETLGTAGVPLRPDRERAWRDFSGWRVNYDSVLLELASITIAPYAPWSSDRSLSRSPRSRWRRSGR
ncbi:MAG: hypothetical protein FJW95_02455 [Actinobacteria bacterium]|nr:hypothetical protein [Actinomycetota bacterium]